MRCWATYRTRRAAEAAAWECPGELVPHGHVHERRHYAKLRWKRGRNHGEALCDESGCRTCTHECACDVCSMAIPLAEVPGRNAVIEDPISYVRYPLRPYQLERGYAK